MEIDAFFQAVTLLVVAGIILWVIFGRRPPPPKGRHGYDDEEEQKPQKLKTEFSKLIMVAILSTYFLGFLLGSWVVVKEMRETGTTTQLGAVLAYTGTPAAMSVAFYCWKSKAENCLKFQQHAPEGTTISDIANIPVNTG